MCAVNALLKPLDTKSDPIVQDHVILEVSMYLPDKFISRILYHRQGYDFCICRGVLHVEKLFDTLKQRKRPEDVAQMILECLAGQLNPDEEHLLQRAARFSLKQSVYDYTSMLEDFSNPVGAQR
jgi:hypothetical protein